MRRWLALFCVWALLLLNVCPLSVLAEEEASTDAFEQALLAEKFPESYLPALRTLHEAYPNWVFRALHTGLAWDEVLDAEAAVGVSLVPTGSIASWKSCEKGAYDPKTGRWFGLDGDAWVAASREIVAYCLDPRNALNDTAIFQFENLAYSDTCQIGGVKAILAGTFMAGDDYAAIFMEAGKLAGVSPYHLASRARQEQGANGNPLGHGTAAGYPGYYNFFNINAYATSTLSAIQNGARYASSTNPTYYLPWTSPTLSIRGGAVILGSSYIAREQNTLYLQKFDVTDGGNGLFHHQYMTNIFAPTSEATSLSGAYSDEVKAGAMEFCIPVYDDMPATPAVKPTAAGDNNNLLKSLAVKGQTLTPTFSMYSTDYEMAVPAEVTTLTLTASAVSKNAAVSGVGTVALKIGMNTLPITVTAASGVTRVYTITVYRAPLSGTGDEPGSTTGGTTPPNKTDPTTGSDPTTGEGTTTTKPTTPPSLSVTTTRYRMEKATLRGVAPDTKAADFLAAFTVSGDTATLAVVNAKGLPVSGTVGTGNVLQLIAHDRLIDSYTVVILGDTSGDGHINSLDLLKMQKQILGLSALTPPAMQAADVNGDGKVNALDLLRAQKTILGKATIEQ